MCGRFSGALTLPSQFLVPANKKWERPLESSSLQTAKSYEILNQYTSGSVFSKVLPIGRNGGPLGTVPELLFEKKGLIPDLQQLLASR
jgi:hypothetical protein